MFTVPGNIYWLLVVHCVSVALTKKDRSRVSAEDILIHEDPRTAVLVRTESLCVHVYKVKKKKQQQINPRQFCTVLSIINFINAGLCHCLTTSRFSTRKEFR